MDVEPKAEEILRSEGYNVRAGTFGNPYKVERDDGFAPVIMNGILPNFAEQEVVVVGLVPGDTLVERRLSL